MVKPIYVTVRCNIFFDTTSIKDRTFKLGLHNKQYQHFFRFNGIYSCDYGEKKEYINMNKVSRIQVIEEDYCDRWEEYKRMMADA